MQAVQLLRERRDAGATLAAVSRQLDIDADRLRGWAHQFSDVPSARPAERESEEVRRLRREVAVLREEREFLKKATAFFAKESR